jgi:hypothetical protein
MRDKGKSHFLGTIAGDHICSAALQEWGELEKFEEAPANQREPNLILPAAMQVGQKNEADLTE